MRGSYNSYVTVEGGLSVMPNRRPLARPFRRNGKPVSSTHSHTSTRTHALTHRSLHIFTWPIDCEMRTALRTAFLSVLCQLLLWAGEHTHTTRYGSVDGAMATGEREAKKIIRYKRNKWWPMETDQLQNRSYSWLWSWVLWSASYIMISMITKMLSNASHHRIFILYRN